MLSAKALGMQVVKSSASGEVLVLCPFHADHNPSAWYNQAKGLLYCSVCGRGWNLQQLSKQLNVDLGDVDEDERGPERYSLIAEEENYDLGACVYNDYFSKRKISEKTIYHYDVRWSDAKNAAVLPVTTVSGQIIGATYRFADAKAAGTRYKNLGKSAPLWPMNLLKHAKTDEVIVVVEGAFSAMRIYDHWLQYGYTSPVLALLGAKANQEILDALAPFRRLWFLYDKDDAGMRARDKMRGLTVNDLIYCISPSPDDMTDKQLDKLLDKINWVESK